MADQYPDSAGITRSLVICRLSGPTSMTASVGSAARQRLLCRRWNARTASVVRMCFGQTARRILPGGTASRVIRPAGSVFEFGDGHRNSIHAAARFLPG